MSLATNVVDLATRVATEAKAIRTLVNGNSADLSGLTTTAKSNLVAAINELQGAIAGASGIDDGTVGTTTSWSSQKTSDEIDAAIAAIVFPDVPVLTDLIDDAAASASTVYSSNKTQTEIAAAVAALVGGASSDLDTLKELADALAADGSAITAINTALGNRVRVDAAQGLTAPQQAQARTNIDAASATEVGNTATNFVTAFEAGLT